MKTSFLYLVYEDWYSDSSFLYFKLCHNEQRTLIEFNVLTIFWQTISTTSPQVYEGWISWMVQLFTMWALSVLIFVFLLYFLRYIYFFLYNIYVFIYRIFNKRSPETLNLCCCNVGLDWNNLFPLRISFFDL